MFPNPQELHDFCSFSRFPMPYSWRKISECISWPTQTRAKESMAEVNGKTRDAEPYRTIAENLNPVADIRVFSKTFHMKQCKYNMPHGYKVEAAVRFSSPPHCEGRELG